VTVRPLRGLHAILLRAHRSTRRRPRTTLVLSLSILIALSAGVPRIKVLLDIGDLVEESLPSTHRNRQARRDFDRGHPLFLVFAPSRPDAVLGSDEIDRISEWITVEEEGNAELIRVVSPFDLVRRKVAGGRLWSIPVLRSRTPEGLASLADTPWGGILTDTAGRDVAMELSFGDEPVGSRFGSFDPARVHEIRAGYRQALGPDTATRVHLSGGAAFEYFSLRGIRRFRVLNLIAVVSIMAAFRVLFGTWRSGALLVGVVGIAFFTVYGAMGLSGTPIDYLSTGLFLMLSVAALEDFLFLSYDQLSRGRAWGSSLRRMLVPSLLTSLTTMIGFAALCLSDLVIVRRFGMWAAFGAAVEWLATFLVLPAFLRLTRARTTWVDPDRAWNPTLPARLVRRSLPRRVALLLLLVIYPLTAAGVWNLDFSDSIVRLFPPGHPHREALEYLERSRGWTAEISVVFPDVREREQVTSALDQLKAHPNVAKVGDPFEILRYMTGGLTAPGAYRSIFSEDGQARASLYLRDVSLDALSSTLDAVEKACVEPECHPVGELVSYAEFSDKVRKALLISFSACLVLVGGLLLGVLRVVGQRRPLLVLGAAFWGPAFMLVVLWLAQIPVTFLTCVFASVLLGLTGDNAIQYAFAGPRSRIVEGVAVRGGASILVALVMGLACLTFLGSDFVHSRRLGILLALGFVASLIGDIWILKSVTAGPDRGAGPFPRG
jgi:predicted RND superfamily exporter protein